LIKKGEGNSAHCLPGGNQILESGQLYKNSKKCQIYFYCITGIQTGKINKKIIFRGRENAGKPHLDASITIHKSLSDQDVISRVNLGRC
jgi:hypothetical protein